jgi:hypothetical protein
VQAAALPVLKRAIFLTPGDSSLYALRAECYIQCCDLKSAVLNFKKCLTIEQHAGRNPLAMKRHISRVLDAQGLSLLQAAALPGHAGRDEALTDGSIWV